MVLELSPNVLREFYMAKKTVTVDQNNWWEFYIVRYAAGTIFGSLLFYAVASNSFLKPMLFGFEEAKDSSKLVYLGLLGFYGLAFCYIASAPILVFHATRFYHQNTAHSVIAKSIAAALFLVTGVLFYCFSNSLVYALIGPVVLTLMVGQFFLVYKTINSSNENFAFYQKLTSARNSVDPELLLSYKHLREHGNSFFIILMEFF